MSWGFKHAIHSDIVRAEPIFVSWKRLSAAVLWEQEQ